MESGICDFVAEKGDFFFFFYYNLYKVSIVERYIFIGLYMYYAYSGELKCNEKEK